MTAGRENPAEAAAKPGRGSGDPPGQQQPRLARIVGRWISPGPRELFRVPPIIPGVASDRAIDLAHDRDLVLAQPVPTASSGDVEHGPVFRADLLMTWFALLEGAEAAGGRGSK
jgi:hypothetical protein